MRNRVGVYIRELEGQRRYLRPHTKNLYAIVDGKPTYVSRGVYHLRYSNHWERSPETIRSRSSYRRSAKLRSSQES
jgi:hypothetical protein